MKKIKKQLFKALILLVLIVSVPVSIYLVSQKTEFFQRASGEPANLVIDASQIIGGKSESWRYLAQGGEEKGRQLLPVIDKTKSLLPKYIRIDHVFDYYNEQELDQVIKDILATGAKPFISLSYMPPQMAKDGNITNEPNNWSEWENLVTKTVERISGRNGLNIGNVYYEVWNEPDLFGKFKISGSKNYLELYSRTARAVQRAKNVNSYKIGGPATTAFYENWMNRLLIFTQENNLPLDFISWHRYSKDLNKYEDDFLGTVNFGGKELIISENGPNSENDSVYDNNFGAMHLIATTALLEGKVDKIFNFEIKDGLGKEKYWGRWGMITHEKWGTPEIKPRYRAVQFLNNLIGGTNIQITGQGSWVKSIAKRYENNKIKILIVNYDRFGKHVEAVPLKVTNLPSNNFKLRRIDFLRGVSTINIAVENLTWESTLYFEPNTASIFELEF
jgi:hypothetical protein